MESEKRRDFRLENRERGGRRRRSRSGWSKCGLKKGALDLEFLSKALTFDIKS